MKGLIFFLFGLVLGYVLIASDPHVTVAHARARNIIYAPCRHEHDLASETIWRSYGNEIVYVKIYCDGSEDDTQAVSTGNWNPNG